MTRNRGLSAISGSPLERKKRLNLGKPWRGLVARVKTSGQSRSSMPVPESWTESHGLTDVQKARLNEYVERYSRIALCTDEADWDTFEAGVRQCYEYGGLQQPKTFIRVQSPVVLALAAPTATATIAVMRDEVLHDARFQPAHVRAVLHSTIDKVGLLDDTVGGKLRQAKLCNAIKKAIDHAVGTTTGSEAWASALCGKSRPDWMCPDWMIEEAIWYKTLALKLSGFEFPNVPYGEVAEDLVVKRAVDQAVRDELDRRTLPRVPEFNQAPGLGAANAVGHYVISETLHSDQWPAVASEVHMERSLDGQFQACWHGYLAFLRDVCEIQIAGDLWDREEAYADAQNSVCCWWVHKDFVMVSNRPERIRLDAQRRLHSEDGMSIRFRDGFGLYHWHGVVVDERVVLRPQELTAQDALWEVDAEVRRVMIERMGMERFLSEANATCIHRHKRGDLFSVRMPPGRLRSEADKVIRIVRVTDPSTGRIYFLRVPPSIKRADDAVAWTFGFKSRKQYQPIVET